MFLRSALDNNKEQIFIQDSATIRAVGRRKTAEKPQVRFGLSSDGQGPTRGFTDSEFYALGLSAPHGFDFLGVAMMMILSLAA